MKLSLDRRQYLWLTLAYFCVALYGSLVPLKFHAVPLDEALERFRQIPYVTLGIVSRADWVANILLFTPLSFLAMGALCIDRRGLVGPVAALVVLPCCVTLSAAIEFLQIFFWPRTVSINDILAETLGAVAGTGIWIVAGRRITVWARHFWSATEMYGLAGRILPGYAFFLVLVNVMPLDLTISPVEVWRKYKEGKIILIPFTAASPDVYHVIEKHLWNIVYYAPVGILWSYLRRWDWSEPRAWGLTALLGLGVAGSIEFMQIFVYTRFFDVTDIITGSQAVLLGWVVGLSFQTPRREADARTRTRTTVLRVASGLAWLGLLVFFNWQPFNLITDHEQLAERIRWINWVPFSEYYWGTEYNAFDQIVRKTLMFMPLGVLLHMTAMRTWRRGRAAALLLGGMVALVMEIGQLFLPVRFPGFTDVLIEAFGVWLGFSLMGWSKSLKAPGTDTPASTSPTYSYSGRDLVGAKERVAR